MKKLLLMLLGVLMTLPMVARDFEYTYEGQTLTYTVISEDDKTCVLTGCNRDEPEDLIIPAVAIDENGNEYNVTEIGDWAFQGCSSLNSVAIPASVTTIGYGAFCGCSSLSSVTIPGSVTTILNDAFNGCSSLSSVSIPASVTTIGYAAFCGCSSLSSVSIPASVTTITSNVFWGCSSLSSVAIPSSVTEIGWMAFYGCSSLSSVAIPASVIEIGVGAFGACSNLSEILAEEDNQYYSSVDGILFDKEQTKLIQFPGGKSGGYTIPSSVTTIMGWAFNGCSSLSSVAIPGSVIEIMYGAFDGCSSLSSVAIPASVTEIGNDAFRGCSSLTSVYYNAQEPIEADSSVFDNYENATLYVPAVAVDKCRLIDPWKNFKYIEVDGLSGIEEVSAGDVPCEVYTTGGVKVDDSTDGLTPGIYIVRQGNDVKKIAVN